MSQVLQVSQTLKETDDSLLITLDLPQNLRKQYKHLPGQFITLETQIEGKLYKRPYSLCGKIGNDHELNILVKRVPGGVVSNYLNEHAKAGAAFKVDPPLGNFVLKPWLLKKEHYVFFAAGCGITPIVSMIENIMKKERFSKVILFYSNKTWESTIFRERLKELWEAYPNRFNFQMILTATTAIGPSAGRLNTQRSKSLLGQHFQNYRKGKYFLCGPTGFMEDIVTALKELEIPAHHIHYESFTGAQFNWVSPASEEAIIQPPAIEAEVEVVVDHKPYKIAVKREQMILDSVLAAKLDVNYSCRSGNCSSCKAKLISGEVTSRPAKGLSKKEIEAGYILTCQSQPANSGVKIEY